MNVCGVEQEDEELGESKPLKGLGGCNLGVEQVLEGLADCNDEALELRESVADRGVKVQLVDRPGGVELFELPQLCVGGEPIDGAFLVVFFFLDPCVFPLMISVSTAIALTNSYKTS